MKVTESQLVEYYFLYKDLVKLHRKFGFGTAPRTSENFTEAICCHLFGFKKAFQLKKTREYDLEDPKTGQKIEVKATTDKKGRTRINPNSRFDKLYWLNFQLDVDVLHIDVKDFTLFSSYLENHSSKERVSITLSEFGQSNLTFFKFEKSGLIVPMDLNGYLTYLKKIPA